MAIVAIDWDHTLMNGRAWLPGAKEALMRLKEEGHVIVIHSCNSASWINMNLAEEGIRGLVDEIVAQGTDVHDDPKPVADIYIDDRGYRFPRNGSWVDEIEKVLETIRHDL